MAMNKSERRTLERILSNLERGLGFVDSPDTFLARKADARTPMTFQREVTPGHVEHVLSPRDPLAYAGTQALSVIAKDIGSEFVLIRTARRELLQLLRPELDL